jgi:hypothetical protein
MLPQYYADGNWKRDLKSGKLILELILWHDTTKSAPRKRWRLGVVDSQCGSTYGSPTGERNGSQHTGQQAVGTLTLMKAGPILYVAYFGIYAELRNQGYGTAFAKRLRTLLTRKSYGFSNAGCTTLALHQVGRALPFWIKATGFRLFLRPADAFFEVKDLTGGGLPTQKQLRGFWRRKCAHAPWVVTRLVKEWGKRVKRAKRAAAKGASGP